MDSCHLFLERPWQFHRHVIFDGRTNTYVVMHGGSRHKLLPLQEAGARGCGVVKCYLCGSHKHQEWRVDEPIHVDEREPSLKGKEHDILEEFIEIKR